jgi:L-fuconolactonase
MIIDAHQHFWNPARGDYGWLTPDLPIHRVYGPDDLAPLLQAAGVDASILVQAAPTTTETDYMLGIARCTSWILGVVGWIDLEAPDAAAQVRARANDELFLGVRPMLQDIAPPDWILRDELGAALAAITETGLVFDALVKSHQIGVVDALAARHPGLSIVLDHGAKPKLGDAAAMTAWRTDMAKLAQRPNVTCKLSGLLTELPPGAAAALVRDAMSVLFDLFGAQRLIWGSDWPVLTLSHVNVGAGDYQGWFAMACDLVASRQAGAVRAVMGANAARIYRAPRQGETDVEMPSHQDCGDCRRWLAEEATGLPLAARHKVLRALEEKHDRRCCVRLIELRDDGEIPAFWNAALDRFWELSA